MNLTHDPIALAHGSFKSTTDQGHDLGQKGVDRYGRVYRYALAGASNLVVGNVLQASAQNTAHQQLTPVATSDVRSITAALGASAAAANLYKDGFAIIDTTPGLGYSYPIARHDAIDSSGTGTFYLGEGATVQTALTTSSRVSLQRNPYAGVIQCPVTTLTGVVVGVAVYPITAAQYGWIGTRGVFGVLIAGTPAVGHTVGVPATAAGAVVIDGAATSGLCIVGKMCVTGVDGKVQAVNINLE
jgi:hypothetical protein